GRLQKRGQRLDSSREHCRWRHWLCESLLPEAKGASKMSVKLKQLDQQVIVITGASSGIGLATAESAAGKGAKVVLAARSGQTLDEIVLRITASGGQAVSVTADVADRKQVEQIA